MIRIKIAFCQKERRPKLGIPAWIYCFQRLAATLRVPRRSAPKYYGGSEQLAAINETLRPLEEQADAQVSYLSFSTR
jgi:hypothetical protein